MDDLFEHNPEYIAWLQWYERMDSHWWFRKAGKWQEFTASEN